MSAYTDWTNLPLGSFSNTYGKSLVSWEFTYQFIQALRMRVFARCGGLYFPPTAHPYAGGIISSLTNTSFVDLAMKNEVDAHGSDKGWHCVEADVEPGYTENDDDNGDEFAGRNVFDASETRSVPQYYDVVIGTDCFREPWLIKRAFITSNGLFTIRFQDLGLESSERGALNGKRYYILQQGRLSWHERILLGTPQVQWKCTYDIIGETQTFAIANATGGTYTLNVDGTDTDDIAWDASEAAVASAINNVISGTAHVSKDETNYLVTFPPSLGDIPEMTADVSSLTGPIGATPAIDFSTIFEGPSSTQVSIRDRGNTYPLIAAWATDQFVHGGSCYVGFVSSTYGGYVRFGEILSNGLDWITFNPNSSGGSGYTPTVTEAPYIVSRRGSPPSWYRFQNDGGLFGHQDSATSLDFSPFQWHGMVSSCWWTRQPAPIEGKSFCGVPIIGIQRKTRDELDQCILAEANQVFDQDYFTTWEDSDACVPWDFIPDGGSPTGSIYEDEFVHPLFYRAWRGIQCAIEWEATNWLLDIDYTNKKAIPNFVPATHFNAAGINSYTTTGTWNTGSESYEIATPINHGVPGGCPVAWAVEHNDAIAASGWFWAYTGATTIPFNAGGNTECAPWCDDSSCSGSGTPSKTGRHIYNGAKVYISYGWTRRYEAMMLHLYDQTGFDPEWDEDGEAISPGASSPGIWETLPASSTYAKYQDFYVPGGVRDVDPTAASNMGQLIDNIEDTLPASGDAKIRYMGDSSACISTDLRSSGSSRATKSVADYEVRGFFEGAYPQPGPSRSGVVIASGPGWIRADARAWLPWGEWSGYSGTASGGSSTTIQDITVWDVWNNSGMVPYLVQGDMRWNTLTNRWNGFIVEILKGPNEGDKAPITNTVDPTGNSHDQSTFDPSSRTPGIITFSIPDFNWQYTVHKFNAANVEVGDTFTITVTGGTSGVVSYTATTTSTTDVANGLKDAWNVANIEASVSGNTLELIIRAGISCTLTPSTMNGGGVNAQTLNYTTETRPVEFKIHEPAYKKDRWAGRKLKVSASTYTITHSDNNTLWFDSSDTPTLGSAFSIAEYEPGRVYSSDGAGGWTKVVSTDDPLGKSALPDFKTSYGRRMHGDIFTTKIYNEAQAAIHVLKATKNDASWFAYDGETINAYGGDSYGLHDPGFLVYGDALASAQSNFGADPPGLDGGVTKKSGDGNTGAPYANFVATWGEHRMINAASQRARPKVTKCSNVPAQIDLYIHTANIGQCSGIANIYYSHYLEFPDNCSGTGSHSWSGCVGSFEESTSEQMTGAETCHDDNGNITLDQTESDDTTYSIGDSTASFHDHHSISASNDGVNYISYFRDVKEDYDDQGVGLRYNRWTKYTSHGPDSADLWIGSFIGDISFPNQTAVDDETGFDPDPPGETAIRGYRVNAQIAILKFVFPSWA